MAFQGEEIVLKGRHVFPEKLSPGQHLFLKREVDNPVHDMAIGAYTTSGVQVGRVDRFTADVLAPNLSLTETVNVFVSKRHKGKYKCTVTVL